jgi:L-fucose isomerase-like protein
MDDKIALVPLMSTLHDDGSVQEVISKYRTWLSGLVDVELQPVAEPGVIYTLDLKKLAGILILVITGGTEKLIRSVASLGKPVLVLAHESMNSLPAALEALPAIDELHPPSLALGQNNVELDKVRHFIKASRTLAHIRNSRLGLIGGASPWLIYSIPDKRSLFRNLGIKLVDIPMSEFKKEYSRSNKELIKELAEKARLKASASDEITLRDFMKSVGVYLAVKKLIERHSLTAVTIRCFDFISDLRATGCYAVSILNDEGFVAGCEGDVPAAAAMITLAEASGRPTFLANPAVVKGHRIVLVHCTISPVLTMRFKYRTHFESRLGVAISGELKKDERVTIARYNKTLTLLRCGEGTIVKGEAWSEELCRTQAEVRMDGDAEIIKERPLGNHYVMTYGEHADALKEVASLAGIDFEEI